MPIISWFILFVLVFYFFMFSIFLPGFFNGFFVRKFYFDFVLMCFSNDALMVKNLNVFCGKLSISIIILWGNFLFLL